MRRSRLTNAQGYRQVKTPAGYPRVCSACNTIFLIICLNSKIFSALECQFLWNQIKLEKNILFVVYESFKTKFFNN